MPNKVKTRRQSRESAYKLIYEYLFSGKLNDRTESIFTAEELPYSETEYIRTVYHGVAEHFDELKSVIEKYAVGFKPDRIFKADMAALMLAIYEMKYMPDIPMSVSISEAVELVKTFLTEKSPTFVNGLLASVYKELSNKQK